MLEALTHASDDVRELNPEVFGSQSIPQTSPLELAFAALWSVLGGPELVREYRFDEVCGWRFDFALPDLCIAIEIDGMWGKGGNPSRHRQPVGYVADCGKLNAATMQGWRVLRLAGPMLKDAEYVRSIIEWVGTQEITIVSTC